MELIQDNFRVEFECIGEGYSGDYDPADPEDAELLRFYISERRDGEWEDADGGSYCTRVPADTDEETQEKLLQLLMKELIAGVEAGESIKKTGERLSWISAADASQAKEVV